MDPVFSTVASYVITSPARGVLSAPVARAPANTAQGSIDNKAGVRRGFENLESAHSQPCPKTTVGNFCGRWRGHASVRSSGETTPTPAASSVLGRDGYGTTLVRDFVELSEP